MLRKTLFWLHLIAGVSAGLVILIMSLTGVLLAFEKQVIAYAERDLWTSHAEASGNPLPLSALLAAAQVAAPEAKASNVTIRADRLAPVTVAFGREKTLFVNPYTGAVLGEGATSVRAFFEANVRLHRWLAMEGEGREQGKAISGASNLAFLFIVASGLFLWIPRTRSRNAFRSVTLFRRGLTGRARDFNWHNVLGIWALVPLFAIVVTAVPISYPWASQLVYRAFGSEPPERPDAARERRGETLDPASLDRSFAAVRAEATRVTPEWKSLALRLPVPPKGPVTVAVDQASGARPDKRSQLVLDLRSGGIEHKTYAQQQAGQQARSWMRWIHTGEAGGIVGQLIAMLASAAGVGLVYTGLALALRRLARTLRGSTARARQLMEGELDS